MMNNSKEELDLLLGEELDHARIRSRDEFAWFDKDQHKLALYGAGTLGRTVLKKLREAGIEPVAFADDTPEKEGTEVDGVRILTPAQVVTTFGSNVVFVVTILNPQLSFLQARQRLLTTSPNVRVISFLSIAWRFPEVFLPYYQFETPEAVLHKGVEIRKGFDLLSDEESRRQYVAQLKFRLYLDYESLPKNAHENYFPHEVLPSLPDETVFVDCGAFDGDTIRDFLRKSSDFARIYAFEPDSRNFSKLQEFVASLEPQTANKINIFNAAVGETRGRISFNATGNMSATVSSEGLETVEVLQLDEVVDSKLGKVFLKFDVEGGEDLALNGASRLLQETKPLIAISIYHRPDDLWALPLRLNSFDSNYDYYLRTQGEDGMDVICYAVPRD